MTSLRACGLDLFVCVWQGLGAEFCRCKKLYTSLFRDKKKMLLDVDARPLGEKSTRSFFALLWPMTPVKGRELQPFSWQAPSLCQPLVDSWFAGERWWSFSMLQMSPVGVYRRFSIPPLSLYVWTTSTSAHTGPVSHHVPSLPQRSSAKEVFLCACALVNLSNVEFYSHFFCSLYRYCFL